MAASVLAAAAVGDPVLFAAKPVDVDGRLDADAAPVLRMLARELVHRMQAAVGPQHPAGEQQRMREIGQPLGRTQERLERAGFGDRVVVHEQIHSAPPARPSSPRGTSGCALVLREGEQLDVSSALRLYVTTTA